MEVKEFLKPNLGKIVLFIFLGVLGFFSTGFIIFCGFSSEPFCGVIAMPLMFTIGNALFFLSFLGGMTLFPVIIVFIFEVLYFYIMSCTILGIYHSIRYRENIKVTMIFLSLLFLFSLFLLLSYFLRFLFK